MDSGPAVVLAQLPLELLLRVISQLCTQDLCSLRLVCKHVEQATFNYFAHEFFAIKKFMLTDDSVQGLLDISRHEALAPVLQSVHIGLDHYLPFRFIQSDEIGRANQFAYAEQFNFLCTGRAVEMLAEAFRNLPNLDTISFRDDDRRGRPQDGFTATWTSYRARRLRRLVSENDNAQTLRSPYHDESFISTVFAITMAALGRADCHIRNLEVMLRGKYYKLQNAAFSLVPTRPGGSGRNPGTADIVATLQSLSVDVSITEPFVAQRLSTGRIRVQTSTAAVVFLRFLAEAHQLKRLRMNFQFSDIGPSDNFIHNLRRLPGSSDDSGAGLVPSANPGSSSSPSPEGIAAPIPSPELPCLEGLELGRAMFSLEELRDLLVRFSMLKSIALSMVSIYRPPDTGFEDTNPWDSILQQLSTMPDLKEVFIRVATTKTATDRGKITFSGKPELYYHRRMGPLVDFLAPIEIEEHFDHQQAPIVIDGDDDDDDVSGDESEESDE